MTNAEQSKKAAQDGEQECRQRTDDRALALVTARFLATHRLFFLLNLFQLAVCLTIFTNFAVIAGFLTAFGVLLYLHERNHGAIPLYVGSHTCGGNCVPALGLAAGDTGCCQTEYMD